MADLPTYDLFAIRYATRAGKRSDHFIGGDPHDGPMPMDYFVWVAVSEAGTYIIDTGFTAETAARTHVPALPGRGAASRRRRSRRGRGRDPHAYALRSRRQLPSFSARA